jgi:hypothetical protein
VTAMTAARMAATMETTTIAVEAATIITAVSATDDRRIIAVVIAVALTIGRRITWPITTAIVGRPVSAKAESTDSDADMNTCISRRRDRSGCTRQQHGTQGDLREGFHDILLVPTHSIAVTLIGNV